MANNKIPLALGFDPATSANTGLEEFVLNVSDIGDICEGDYSPSPGDVLTYNADAGCWTASATPAVAAGALSALTDICTAVTSVTQYQALVWNGTAWCPSTIPTGGGGGDPLPTATNAGDIILADGPGTAYSASAPSDAGIMQLDPYFTANDDGKTAVWDGSQLTVEYPDRLFIRVQAGETLTAGDLVYVSEAGPNNNTVKVMKAQADSAATMPAIGMVFDGLAVNQVGTVISFGKSSPVNVGTVAIGTTVYVDPDTPGAFTTTKPTTTATDLIQNIGFVAASGSNGIVKLTGVGRSNDIPNNLDVVGSATIGTNEFTQTSAKLANVGADHILISTATSATSSVASATLFGNYYTQDQVYTKTEADAAFLEDSASSINPPNLSGTITNGQLIKRSSDTQFAGVTTTANSETFLGTNANLEDVTNVTATPVNRDLLQYDGTNWEPRTLAEVQTNSDITGRMDLGTLGDVNDSDAPPSTDIVQYQALVYDTGNTDYRIQVLEHNNLSGLGDDDHTQYVLSAGTRAMSALTVTTEITTKDIEVTRLGQGRPTNFTWTSDYLAPQVFQNGWLQAFGTGGSIGGDSTMLNQYQDAAGIISLGVNANSSARASMYTNNTTLYASGQAWSFATRACMQSSSVAGATYSGVIGVANSATDYNLPSYGVYFLCGHGGGNWIARTSGQFGNTETDTGVALSSYTLSVLQIMCNEDWSKAEFYIDGNKVATHTTNLPNRVVNTGFLYKLWNNGTPTAGGKMYVDWHDIKIINTSVDRGEGHIKDFSDFTP